MASAQIEETLPVSRKRLLDVIRAYDEYPEFVDGVKKIQVERLSEQKAHVTYHIHIVREAKYILEIEENPEQGKVSWKLHGTSDLFQKNSGFWEIEEVGPNESRVKYGIEVEFNIPVPGFILNKLVKGNLPKVLENFKNRALRTFN